MNTFEQWKNLKEEIAPAPEFRARTRTSLLREARALGRERPALSRAVAGFSLGVSLAVAGLLIASSLRGEVRGGLRAQAPVFQITVGQARYEVTDAARVALTQLEEKIMTLGAAEQGDLLERIEYLKRLLN